MKGLTRILMALTLVLCCCHMPEDTRTAGQKREAYRERCFRDAHTNLRYCLGRCPKCPDCWGCECNLSSACPDTCGSAHDTETQECRDKYKRKEKP